MDEFNFKFFIQLMLLFKASNKGLNFNMDINLILILQEFYILINYFYYFG